MYSETNTSVSTHRNPTPRDRSRKVELRNVGGGFPHSEIVGSKPVRSSPTLIAAYHVLHRLSAPRHPPNALKTLDRSHDRRPPARPRSEDPGQTSKTPILKVLDQLASWFALRTPRSGGAPFGPTGAACNSPGGRTNQRFTMSDNTRTARALR